MDKYAAFVGVAASDPVGMDLAEVTHRDDVAFSKDSVNRLLRGESVTEPTDERFVRPNGEIVWGRFHASLIRDEQG